MSVLADIFIPGGIGDNYRNWPLTSNNVIRNVETSAAVTFEDEAGYVLVKTTVGRSDVEVITYPTKTNLRRTPADMVFHINKSPREFIENGVSDLNDITIEEREGPNPDTKNKLVHVFRLFADSFGNPGSGHAGRSSF